jgi:hypothetical protein
MLSIQSEEKSRAVPYLLLGYEPMVDKTTERAPGSIYRGTSQSRDLSTTGRTR